ncbi:phosphatidylserine decarboxylase [Candidatus Woesearchaeota archaeon]|nr:phosphatidylserine decarboxylase [Candidatus Woesearchaeota archaeon]
MASEISVVVLIALVVVLAAIALLSVFYRFYFLRKPRRDVPAGDVLVSPASGKVVRIISIGDGVASAGISKGLLGKIDLLVRDTIKRGYVIVIMMTPFDVHFQRAPADCVVEKVSYTRGRFLNAVKDAASLRALVNERNEILLRHRRVGKLKVVQVAGFMARRIRCFVRPKQKIHKGGELGLICLGSQVILVIPDVKVLVSEGQKVVDGETAVARF